MKTAELREKSDQELRDMETQMRDELFRLQLKQYTGQLQNTSELTNKRRTIARIKTILTERSA